MKCVFVVGCPRSGTTLLQAVLAAHPGIATVPETHFASKIRGRWAGLSTPFVWPRAARIQLQAHRRTTEWTGTSVVPWSFRPGPYHRAFAAAVTAFTARKGATVWLEKSPIHLRYIDELARHHPEARFVHIVRDGRAVTASLVDLALSEPEGWLRQLDRSWTTDYGSVPKTAIIDAAASRWNADVAISRRYLADPRHTIIQYDDLAAGTADENIAEVLRELGLPVLPLDHAHVVADVVGHRAQRSHMQEVLGSMRPPSLTKFHRVFDASEQQAVVQLLTAGGDARAALA